MKPFEVKWLEFEEPQLPRRSRLRFWLRRLQYEVSVYRGFKHRESLPVKIVAVAAITLILALILFPVFVTPPHGCRAPYSSCMSNQKQIALGFVMYAQDNDDYLPRASVWMDATIIYEKNESIYRCPGLYKKGQNTYGYAFNSRLAAQTVQRWSHPESLPLLYDTDLTERNAAAVGRSGLANPPHHNRNDIMAFLDGHARPVDARGVLWSASQTPSTPNPFSQHWEKGKSLDL